MEANASYSDFPSDTNLLVAVCIERVREAARLDDDAVLPPLPPQLSPRREVVILTKSEVAGKQEEQAGTRTGHGAASAQAGGASRTSRELAATRCVSRQSPKAKGTSRWALFMCGFVASGAACAALLVSPVGRWPEVQQVTSAAHGHAANAIHAAKSRLFK
jgi:hypothetical protein